MRPVKPTSILLLLAAVLAAAAVSPALGQDAGEDPGAISPMAVGSLHDGQGAFDLLSTPADIKAFSISNRTYALATSELGIQILDVTDPGAPVSVASIANDRDESYYGGGSDHAGVFSVSGHMYAIVATSNTLKIINVTSPDIPATVASIRSGQDNYYTLRHLPPEQVEEALAGYPDARDISYTLDQISDIETVTTVSGRVYALLSSSSDDGIQIVDVTRPQTPVLAASIQDSLDGFYTLGNPRDIETFAISGHTYALVYSLEDDGVQIINITEPGEPKPVASIRDGQDGLYSLDSYGEAEVFTTAGRTYALLAGSGNNPLQIVDLTDPASPQPVPPTQNGQDGFEAAGSPKATFATAGRTYALLAGSGNNPLQIVDLTDPASPQPVSAIQDGEDGRHYLPYYGDAEVFAASDRTYAIISGPGDDPLRIIDLTDPAAPQDMASIQGGFVLHMFESGPADMQIFTTAAGRTYALLAGSGDDLLRIIDLTDPAAPEQLAAIRDGQEGFDGLGHPLDLETFAVSGETYALVSSGRYGTVQVLNVSDPSAPLTVNGIWDGSGNMEVFTASNQTYALLMSSNSIQIINITDPATSSTISGARPSERFFFGPGDSVGVGIFAVSGHMYAMAPPRFGYEILIADITDVEAPAFFDPVEIEPNRFFPVFTDPTDIEMFTAYGRTYALMSGYSDFEVAGTLQIIDATRPQDPVLLVTILGGRDGFDTLRAPVDVEAFTADGRAYALVVDYGFGSEGSVQVVDITDPAEPLPVTTIRGGQDGFDAMDNPVDIETFVVDGVTYALVSNPGGSALQVISLAGQGAAP